MAHDFESEIRNEFLSESIELLENLEHDLLSFESHQDHALLENIFRIAHTFKGSGYAAGFNELANIAHEMEQILDQLRHQTLECSRDVVDALLVFKDLLQTGIQRLREDANTILSVTEAQQLASQFLGSKQSEQPTDNPSQPAFGLFDEDDSPPAAVTKQPQPAATTPKQQDADDRPTILLVDDEADILEVNSILLEGEGFRTIRCNNGNEALAHFETNDIDTVVTDFQMPGLNGLDLAKAIAAIDVDVPIIIVSGHSNQGHIREFLNNHIFYFLPKPYNHDELTDATHRAVQERRHHIKLNHLARLNFRIFSKYHALLADSAFKERFQHEFEELAQLTQEIQSTTHDLMAYKKPRGK